MCCFFCWNSTVGMRLLSAGHLCQGVSLPTRAVNLQRFSPLCLCTPVGFTCWEICSICGSSVIMSRIDWDTRCTSSSTFCVELAQPLLNWLLAWVQISQTWEPPERSRVCWARTLLCSRVEELMSCWDAL